MNLDTIDLSTWRDEAPPTELRGRIALKPSPPLIARPLPRLGFLVAGAAGVGATALFATAPVSAEALLRRAQSIPSAHAIHMVKLNAVPDPERPSWSDGGVTEIWATPVVRRETLRYPHSPRAELDGSGHPLTTDVDHDAISVRIDGSGTLETRAAAFVLAEGRRGDISGSASNAPPLSNPRGVFRIDRLRGRLRVTPENPEALNDYAVPFRLEWIEPHLGGRTEIRVREIEGTDEVRMILVSGSQPVRFKIAIDRQSGRVSEVAKETGGENRWRLDSTLRIDYPDALDPKLFDPETILP